MKFVLALVAVAAYFTEDVSAKRHHESQSTRNYRHNNPDPSFNPLPSHWSTGPRTNYTLSAPSKYRKELATHHTYSNHNLRHL